MLVPKGRRWVGVLAATHQFSNRRSGRGGPREPQVAQVVVEEVRPSNGLSGPLPDPVDRAGQHRSDGLGGEEPVSGIRPENRVRAHVLLCLLAGYLTWHLRRAVAPLTFSDTERGPQSTRLDPVSPALASPTTRAKAATKHTETGEPVHSYQSLLEHLKTLTRSTCRIAGSDMTFDKLSEPTPTQRRVFDLIAKPIPLHLMQAERQHQPRLQPGTSHPPQRKSGLAR